MAGGRRVTTPRRIRFRPELTRRPPRDVTSTDDDDDDDEDDDYADDADGADDVKDSAAAADDDGEGDVDAIDATDREMATATPTPRRPFDAPLDRNIRSRLRDSSGFFGIFQDSSVFSSEIY